MSKNLQIPFLILIFGCAAVVWLQVLQKNNTSNEQGNWQLNRYFLIQENS